MPRGNLTSVALLTMILLIGCNAMFGLALRNGYVDALYRLRDHGPHVLPGSSNPILTWYTGFSFLDKLLALANVLWANVTDGSAPALSLYMFYFAGQLVPVFTAMVVEGLREGNRGGVCSPSILWGCQMQSTGYGIIMPLYAITHLLVSKTSTSTSTSATTFTTLSHPLSIPSRALETLPWALTLGYFVPTVLMAWPFRSTALHQWFVGFWQLFPAWVILLQYAFRLFHAAPPSVTQTPSPSDKTTGAKPTPRAQELAALHRVYLFAFTTAATIHIATLTLLATIHLFPTLFPPSLHQTLTFSNVFLPPRFYPAAQMTDMASAMHGFYQWDQYVGSAAALVWAVTMDVNSRAGDAAASVRKWMEVVGSVVVAGPCGALVLLLWRRDERVLG